MHPVLLGVALSMVGLKVGWEPAKSGGTCYIIQLDAHDVDVFKREQRIDSAIPAGLQDVREFRFEIGSIDPPQRPSREELKRKAEQVKADKRAPPGAGGSPRGDPDDQRWSGESWKNLLDAPPPTSSAAKRQGELAKKPLSSARDPADTAQKATPDPLRQIFGGVYRPISPPPQTSNAKAEVKKTDPKKSDPPKKVDPKEEEPKRAASTTGLSLALLGSLGGNCFLIWVLWESRIRFRALLRRRYGVEPLDAAESVAAG
jgi:hypothetical protein